MSNFFFLTASACAPRGCVVCVVCVADIALLATVFPAVLPAGLQWSCLFRGTLVVEVELGAPAVAIDLGLFADDPRVVPRPNRDDEDGPRAELPSLPPPPPPEMTYAESCLLRMLGGAVVLKRVWGPDAALHGPCASASESWQTVGDVFFGSVALCA